MKWVSAHREVVPPTVITVGSGYAGLIGAYHLRRRVRIGEARRAGIGGPVSYSARMLVFSTRSVWVMGVTLLATLAGCSSSGVSISASTTTSAPEMESSTAAVQTIVSDLQIDLETFGYDAGSISGSFTAATGSALVKFQKESSVPLSEQGAVGPDTARALANRLSGASDTVGALQSALTDVGLFRGTIDGHYGSDTLTAVEVLQTHAHINVDGLFGPASARALSALYSKDVPEPASGAPSTAVTSPPTTVGATPSTAVTTPPTTVVGGSGLLKIGSKGAAVRSLQRRLAVLGYRPGTPDGIFGTATASAVLAFQKRNDLGRDGVAGPAVLGAIGDPTGLGPRSGGPPRRIEVDIARQIVFVIIPGRPVVTLNASTGNGETYRVAGGTTDVAYTPVGSFTVERKIVGDEVAPLGTLHSPMYFYKGWALHGSPSVPAYPASHGCVRLSNTDADWLFPLASIGTAVVLYDTTGNSPGPDGLPADAGAGD